MTFDLIIEFGSKFGNLFVFAYVLSKIKAFRQLVSKEDVTRRDQMILAIIFGLFGILGTYFSVEYNGALANTRIIGVACGGLIGGPFVGTIAGLIAGVHRGFFNAGSLTSTICAVSTVLEGFMAGCMGLWIKNKKVKWPYAALTGAMAETLRKILLLIFIKPFSVAWELVADIGMPLIIINSIGLALLIIIIENIFVEQERISAEKAQLALDIADEAMPYLKRGINASDFEFITQLICKKTDFDSAAVFTRSGIIANSGLLEVESMRPLRYKLLFKEQELQNRKSYIENQYKYVQNGQSAIGSYIAVSLLSAEQRLGWMVFFKRQMNGITSVEMKLAKGLAKLFSTEIKIAVLEQQAKLVAEAELKALQAQINPHFMFNSLTVIASLCRKDALKARELILHLSSFMRKSLTDIRDTVDIHEEINHIKAYVAIEQARFDERLEVQFDVDDSISFQLPPLSLQPIVEHSVKHRI